MANVQRPRLVQRTGASAGTFFPRDPPTPAARRDKVLTPGCITSSELAAIEALSAYADLRYEIPARSRMTELPPANTRRWVARRKTAGVAAVSSGMLTIEEACRRYQISEEEFSAWQRAFERYGIVGLRASYAQQHRSARPKAPKTKK